MNIFAGPQLGFNVHNKFKLDGHKKEYVAVNVDKLFYPFDFSLCVGGGYQFENGLFFTLNYNFGLTDVLKYKDIKSRRNQLLPPYGGRVYRPQRRVPSEYWLEVLTIQINTIQKADIHESYRLFYDRKPRNSPLAQQSKM